MISGLGGATIWSSDLNNLLPFYRDVVGLKVTVDTPQFALLGPESQPSLGLGTHSEVRGKASDPYRHMVGFTTDNIRADFERMKKAGAEFIEEPNQQDGLMLATFTTLFFVPVVYSVLRKRPPETHVEKELQ